MFKKESSISVSLSLSRSSYPFDINSDNEQSSMNKKNALYGSISSWSQVKWGSIKIHVEEIQMAPSSMADITNDMYR